MKLPAIRARIDRRILANYRVDPEVLQRQVPKPFRVQAVAGYGIAGICLIRLVQARPFFMPGVLGFASENAAHRIAVDWETSEGVREGVYVPRRDTSSRMNALVGGRVFPGEHSRALFEVEESATRYRVGLRSVDGKTRAAVEAEVVEALPEGSVFGDLATASAFFERGSLGYSATSREGCFECLELDSFSWEAQALRVHRFESSFFDDSAAFPAGSAEFDSALLMRGIEHRWIAHPGIEGA